MRTLRFAGERTGISDSTETSVGNVASLQLLNRFVFLLFIFKFIIVIIFIFITDHLS